MTRAAMLRGLRAASVAVPTEGFARMTDQSTGAASPRSRRSLLAAAAGAAAAAAVASLRQAAAVRATDGQTVTVGGSFSATNPTFINAAGATAFAATSDTNAALTGSSSSGNGLGGYSGSANGVYGSSLDDVGVYGITLAAAQYGVFGYSGSTSIGTCGLSVSGIGVLGMTGGLANKPAALADTGVYGYAVKSPSSIGVRGGTTSGTGVLAEATTGNALKVTGKAQFSRSGVTAILRSHSSVKVTMAGVTKSSYVVATLQTNRAGVYVQAAVPTTGSFTIYLNKAVTSATKVGYFVIN